MNFKKKEKKERTKNHLFPSPLIWLGLKYITQLLTQIGKNTKNLRFTLVKKNNFIWLQKDKYTFFLSYCHSCTIGEHCVNRAQCF